MHVVFILYKRLQAICVYVHMFMYVSVYVYISPLYVRSKTRRKTKTRRGQIGNCQSKGEGIKVSKMG